MEEEKQEFKFKFGELIKWKNISTGRNGVGKIIGRSHLSIRNGVKQDYNSYIVNNSTGSLLSVFTDTDFQNLDLYSNYGYRVAEHNARSLAKSTWAVFVYRYIAFNNKSVIALKNKKIILFENCQFVSTASDIFRHKFNISPNECGFRGRTDQYFYGDENCIGKAWDWYFANNSAHLEAPRYTLQGINVSPKFDLEALYNHPAVLVIFEEDKSNVRI